MKIKTYVLTVSRLFPTTHPRKGEETGFADKIYHLDKKHTIRANYAYWKPRIDSINRGEGYLSVREWIGKPYASKQRIIAICAKGEIDIQECDVFISEKGYIGVKINKSYLPGLTVLTLIKNDGLTNEDFKAWFKKPILNGCIIHFTDLRY